MSQIGPGGLGIVVAHQTLNDLLLQLLVDGTDDNWKYGQPGNAACCLLPAACEELSWRVAVFKLKNAAMVEVTVGAEAFSGGPVHYIASRPMTAAPPAQISDLVDSLDSNCDTPGNPLSNVFSQWASGCKAEEPESESLDAKSLFQTWSMQVMPL